MAGSRERMKEKLQKKRIGLLGCGALSRTFLKIYREYLTEDYETVGIFTRSPEKAKDLQDHYVLCSSMEELLKEAPEIIVEFAGVEAVREYGVQILEQRISLVAASIGALADLQFYGKMQRAAKASGAKLYLTSGAIGGFDVMRTMAMDGTATVKIINKKSPAGLNGAPGLQGRELSEEQEELIFQGNALQAIHEFPKSVNVAVAASLAVADTEHSQVEIHSVPGLKENSHRILVENSLGKADLEITSKPDPDNPKSSTITAWSTAALLKNLASPVQFF